MRSTGKKTMQAGSWQSAKSCSTSREVVNVRVSQSGRRLVHIDADEPSDAMMAKIASVVDQTKLSADESI